MENSIVMPENTIKFAVGQFDFNTTDGMHPLLNPAFSVCVLGVREDNSLISAIPDAIKSKIGPAIEITLRSRLLGKGVGQSYMIPGLPANPNCMVMLVRVKPDSDSYLKAIKSIMGTLKSLDLAKHEHIYIDLSQDQGDIIGAEGDIVGKTDAYWKVKYGIKTIIETLHTVTRKSTQEKSPQFKAITLGVDSDSAINGISQGVGLGVGTNIAKELSALRPNECNADLFASYCASIAQRFPHNVKVEVVKKDELLKRGFNGINLVAQGSADDAMAVILTYTGRPKSNKYFVNAAKTVLFDLGGTDIKMNPRNMHTDKNAGCNAIGHIYASAYAKAPVNVCVVLPIVKNLINHDAALAGDIYTNAFGRTIEVGNTDAEGRLILEVIRLAMERYGANAIYMTSATLTGSATYAVGPMFSALMSNDKYYREMLVNAGEYSADYFHPILKGKEYLDAFEKNTIADSDNTAGRGPGCHYAGIFIYNNYIVPGQKAYNDDKALSWLHLDIAAVGRNRIVLPGLDAFARRLASDGYFD